MKEVLEDLEIGKYKRVMVKTNTLEENKEEEKNENGIARLRN